MPSGRLQQQFIRLWQCCEGQSQETTLNELADLLSCSRRHMRTLLNTMQQQELGKYLQHSNYSLQQQFDLFVDQLQ